MQTNVSLNRPRRGTLLFGFIFGIIAILIILGYGAIRGFQTSQQTNNSTGWLVLVAFIVPPLLAGLFTAIRSGRIGSGTLSGLLAGVLGGLGAAAYVLIIYFTSSSVNTAVQSINNQLKQANASFTITSSALLASIIVAAIILVIVFLAFGTLFGLIGAAIGKAIRPRPRYA